MDFSLKIQILKKAGMKKQKTIDQYSNWTEKVWFSSNQKPNHLSDLSIMGFGLGGETGEVLELLKKQIRDGTYDSKNLRKELGDVLYYWARICKEFGFKPSSIMNMNIDKIESRRAKNTLRGSGNDR